MEGRGVVTAAEALAALAPGETLVVVWLGEAGWEYGRAELFPPAPRASGWHVRRLALSTHAGEIAVLLLTTHADSGCL